MKLDAAIALLHSTRYRQIWQAFTLFARHTLIFLSQRGPQGQTTAVFLILFVAEDDVCQQGRNPRPHG